MVKRVESKYKIRTHFVRCWILSCWKKWTKCITIFFLLHYLLSVQPYHQLLYKLKIYFPKFLFHIVQVTVCQGGAPPGFRRQRKKEASVYRSRGDCESLTTSYWVFENRLLDCFSLKSSVVTIFTTCTFSSSCVNL